MTQLIAELRRALDSTAAIVSAVAVDQWTRPSPCEGWTVRDECNHLVGGLRIFTAQITGETLDADHDDHDWLGVDAVSAYRAAAAGDADAWGRPEAMATVFDLAFGQVPAPMALMVHLTEVVVHGLDLAVATGNEALADEESAASLLATMREMGTDAFRVPGIFGPEVAATPGTPAHRRLLAYLGRDLHPVPA